MKEANRKQIPSSYNYHDRYLTNKDNQTVAMILAKNGIIPPKEWMHDDSIIDYQDESLSDILAKHYLCSPKHWLDESEFTIFDKACYGEIPNI